MSSKTLLLSGFQDFLPVRMLQRNVLIATAKTCFEKFGFLVQDTPCVERAELLLGKYGDGEKLIYSFFDHGNRHISLRYDLTVPLSRVVKTYTNEIVFPYRRYQVGMVWRADKPGKGRYREFMQMDADIVDDDSLLSDVEILLLVRDLMVAFGTQATIRFNCRQILDALVEVCKLDQVDGVKLMRVVDKFDKIGKVGVLSELTNIGLSNNVRDIVSRYLEISGTNDVVLHDLFDLLYDTPTFQLGFSRLSSIINTIRKCDNDDVNFKIDPTIARGLDYYTGIIFETTLIENPDFGSVCSGGRYDRLIRHSDDRLLPSIGLSIGIDRLFAAMESVNKLPSIETTTQVFIVNFNEIDISEYLKLAGQLRSVGVAVEIFTNSVGIAKQLKVANNRHIPLVLIMGANELSRSQVLMKNMLTGSQVAINRNDIVSTVLQFFDAPSKSPTK